MNTLVSINCKAYNHQNYIGDAIESFLMQKTNFDFEIIIGEDCSTDSTRKIITDYQKKNPGKIKLITSDQNVGMIKNFQRILDISKGKYIALCDGDDYWNDPYKLQKQVEFMEKHPECSMCFHSAEIVKANKKVTGHIIRPYNKDTIVSKEDVIMQGYIFPTTSLLFPRKMFENIPEFFNTSPVGDYPIVMILSTKGSVYYLDTVMSAYRTGISESWTSRMSAESEEKRIKHWEDIICMLDEFDKYSKYQYSAVVENAKISFEFQLTHNLKVLTSPRFKETYNALATKVKIKFHVRHYFPRIYKLAKAIRYHVRQYL